MDKSVLHLNVGKPFGFSVFENNVQILGFLHKLSERPIH